MAQTAIIQVGIEDINLLLLAVTPQIQGDTAPMKSFICSLVSERCVVLAAGLGNWGILMFMNPDPRAGPEPEGGRKSSNMFLQSFLRNVGP